MPALRVEKCLCQGNNLSVPLISGEFHYWRVLKENWRPIARRIREMGVEVVASYVPWNYHELEPGRYDFTGETSPQRDLKGFVELLKEEGLWLIARPGPYIYSEWEFGGVPERAARHHRMAPEFLDMAKDYIQSVCEILTPCQVTKGGPVILFQADNEPYPPLDSFGSEMGAFDKPGVFKDWLRERYDGDIARLNAVWRTEYEDFDRACAYFHEAYVNTDLPMADRLFPGEEYRMRYADTLAFIGWYAARIVDTVAGWLRDAGVEVPVYANGWSPLFQDFHEFTTVSDLSGTDLYPSPFFTGDRPVKDNWFYNLDIVKLQEADVSGGNVWSAEFQCGIFPIQQCGYLPPRHFKTVALSLMARGLRGWNWYMLVNRDNWHHCPINEWGRTNEYFPVHRDIVSATRRIEPWRTAECHDVSLLCYKPHRVIDPGNFEAVFRSLEEGDIAFDYYNPQGAAEPSGDVLLYAGSDWLDRASLERLADWVATGGTLICFNRFPVRDETGAVFEELLFQKPDGARPVGLPADVLCGDQRVRLEHGGHQGRKINVAFYHDVEGEPVCLGLSTEAREELVDIGATEERTFIMGYRRTVGKGTLLHLGCNPSAAVLRMALERERGQPHVLCDDPCILTSIHRHEDGHHVLYVINRGDEPRRANVRLNAEKLGVDLRSAAALDLYDGSSAPAQDAVRDGCLLIPVGGRDVAVWRIG
jgi:hypothetical protein